MVRTTALLIPRMGGRCVAISPDARAAVWLGKMQIHFIDVAQAKEVAVLPAKASYYTARFSPDGKTLLTLGEHDTTLWDSATRTEKATFHNSQLGNREAAFSADGRRLVFAAGKELIFLDPRNGELLGVMRPAGNHSAALSADGRLVATMRGGSGDVLLTEATALMLDGIDALVTKLAPGATIASPTDVLENAKGKAVIAGVPATPNNPPVAPPPRVIPDPLATRIRPTDSFT